MDIILGRVKFSIQWSLELFEISMLLHMGGSRLPFTLNWFFVIDYLYDFPNLLGQQISLVKFH